VPANPPQFTDDPNAGFAVLVATALAIGLGLLVAALVSSLLDPSYLVPEVVVEPYRGGYLHVRLVAILFSVPVAACLAAAVSSSATRTHNLRTAVMEGAISGVLVAAILGFLAISIGTWWVDAVPRNPNAAVAILVPVLALFTSFTIAFVLEATGRGTNASARSLLFRLLFGTASFSLFLGSLFGAIVGGIAQLSGCGAITNGCATLTISAAMESGAFIGAGIGLNLGLVAAAVVWMLGRTWIREPAHSVPTD
jgi:hypothetical protein